MKKLLQLHDYNTAIHYCHWVGSISHKGVHKRNLYSLILLKMTFTSFRSRGVFIFSLILGHFQGWVYRTRGTSEVRYIEQEALSGWVYQTRDTFGVGISNKRHFRGEVYRTKGTVRVEYIEQEALSGWNISNKRHFQVGVYWTRGTFKVEYIEEALSGWVYQTWSKKCFSNIDLSCMSLSCIYLYTWVTLVVLRIKEIYHFNFSKSNKVAFSFLMKTQC